ncbi:uncharacterized protein LOC142180944 [Nicotiana tabacum]|uniref:Uncharacterized protein LOC142180944 n=1 Tax=Nicotiana tabacum TaxID=4097 RepID=A0AC58UI45_TOBAC
MAVLENRVKETNADSIIKNVFNTWKWIANYYTAPGGRIWVVWDQTKVDFESSTKFNFGAVYGMHTIQDRKGNVVQEFEVRDFKEFILDVGLAELRTVGRNYTWTNNHVHGKIDRIFVNAEWIQNWPTMEESILKPSFFDHCPLNKTLDDNNQAGSRLFKFLNFLSQYKFEDTVKQCWIKESKGNLMFKVWNKFKLLKVELKQLHSQDFNNIEHKFKQQDPNWKLIRPVTRDEVKQAIQDIDDNKALGCNGYNSFFFKKTWHILGKEFTEAVMDFFKSAEMCKPVNCTTITLIPKLCSKKIDHRQHHLSHELVKGYGRKNISPRCMLKIDMQKAYDSVEWVYFEQVMRLLGIPEKFVKWIMVCISTVSYSVIINGKPTKPFEVRKGLRQGDISLLLFVMAMDNLCRLMKQLRNNKELKFYPRCAKVNLVQLGFAGDLLLFRKGEYINRNKEPRDDDQKEIKDMLKCFMELYDKRTLQIQRQEATIHNLETQANNLIEPCKAQQVDIVDSSQYEHKLAAEISIILEDLKNTRMR